MQSENATELQAEAAEGLAAAGEVLGRPLWEGKAAARRRAELIARGPAWLAEAVRHHSPPIQ